MGQFIEQVERNNRLQVQELSYKKQVQLQKEEAKRQREAEKQQKLLYNQLLIDTQVFFNNLIEKIYNEKNYKKAYIYLFNNYHDLTKKYIKIQLETLEECEKNKYIVQCKTLFEKINNKYYNNFNKINSMTKNEIQKKKTVKTQQKATLGQHAIAASLGIATGFIWGVLGSGKKKRRGYKF
jgi:hypothetical protein